MDTVQPKSTAPERRRSGPRSIHLVSVRAELAPRREPYWGVPLRKGHHVGLRKISAQDASWIARYRPEGGKQEYHKLGLLRPDFGYDRAKVEAEKWFKEKAAGAPPSDVVTVEDACRAYLAEKRAANQEAKADDAERRFERVIYGRVKSSRRKAIEPNSIAKVHLSRLTVTQIKKWRNELPIKNLSTANRTLAAVKAALNLAVTNNPALATKGLEWSAVVPHEIEEDTRRLLVLDLKQRRALLAAAVGPVRDLIQATSLTGARAGELTHATVSQFKPRAHEITLSGKTGTRPVKLSAAACALFKRLAKGKKPNERLLTREEGKAWGHSDWDELVKDAAKAAKLPPETCLYTLRHSWISEQIAGGMTTLDVARLAGTSLVMIELHYGKVSKDVQQRLNKVAML
jgi:site-specific recombinase XerD